MGESLLAILGGGAGGAVILAIIQKIRNKGDIQKDTASVLQTITAAFETTLASVQESSSKAIEAANNNFNMSMEREKRLIALLAEDAAYKIRTDKKLDELEKKYNFRGITINKATDCKFLKNKPNTECPVIVANNCTECKGEKQ